MHLQYPLMPITQPLTWWRRPWGTSWCIGRPSWDNMCEDSVKYQPIWGKSLHWDWWRSRCRQCLIFDIKNIDILDNRVTSSRGCLSANRATSSRGCLSAKARDLLGNRRPLAIFQGPEYVTGSTIIRRFRAADGDYIMFGFSVMIAYSTLFRYSVDTVVIMIGIS
jgi:hypothetical protein